MKTIRRFWQGLGLLALSLLMVGVSVPGMAAGQIANAADQKEGAEVQAMKTPETILEKNVRHELLMLPYYTIFDNLEFQINNGDTVVLSGEVVWPVLKSDAGRIVERIEGVKKVVNDIKVLPLSPFDNSIRRAEFRAIYGALGFERYAIQAYPPIHIIVDNGNVTLVGVVATKSDRIIAGLQAHGVPDVFQVTNDLRVENNG